MRRGGRGRPQQPEAPKDRINKAINVPEVRLVDADGEQAGVVSIDRALEMAQEAGLDLVEVATKASPPVCKIMDYGKYLYQQQKKQHEAKKKQKQVQVKEVKFRPGTEEGDYQVKLRNLIKFLEKGDRVKVTIWFRGREITHKELGLKVLERVKVDVEEFGTVEQMPKMEGRQMQMMVAPTNKKK
ncbi:translation initiation factor IF-3 [Thiomicrorhabdus sediminis]|uniref:Translation initiation factor IF-3 n=1 Tax=Thiomicrorhabdus sediminis TaxID=2580412 RepID=A0A4P9K6R1_9GAMM|nr:translation initiation factor IF-3 [Thiomicrorhabdus sediminis]QCU90561.1 translation initiation factor IF-3 [Thiomicrorhabdus sediminis]